MAAAAAAAAEGWGEAEPAVGAAAAETERRWSWRWESSLKGGPPTLQRRRTRKMRWRTPRGAYEESVMTTRSCLKSSHYWNCFWYPSPLRKKTKRRMRSREAE